jgi:ABC-type nitrate/sulfonate/bicarbonate transport system permease component
MSRLFSQIILLVSLSWTYIIIVEVINSGAGGIGSLSYIASRQSRIDKVFAILLIIIFYGGDFTIIYLKDMIMKNDLKVESQISGKKVKEVSWDICYKIINSSSKG